MRILLLILISSPLISQDTISTTQEPNTFIITENFNDLNNWENFSFTNNKTPTQYSIVSDSITSYLQIITNSSASGLIHTREFDPNLYPILSWRWQINTMIKDADGRTKSGDDYPIRIFVMFDDDSAEISFWTSLRNSAAKLLYGSEPPESSLCFVWIHQNFSEQFFDNPYSDTVKMIPIRMGDNGIKDWHSHQVNIVDYFEIIYNRSCPSSAKIAIMGDSDNTESMSEAGLDYIRISSE